MRQVTVWTFDGEHSRQSPVALGINFKPGGNFVARGGDLLSSRSSEPKKAAYMPRPAGASSRSRAVSVAEDGFSPVLAIGATDGWGPALVQRALPFSD